MRFFYVLFFFSFPSFLFSQGESTLRVLAGPAFLSGEAKFSRGSQSYSGYPSGWLGSALVEERVGEWKISLGADGLFARSSGELKITNAYYKINSTVDQTTILPRVTLSKPVWKNSFFLLEPSLSMMGGYVSYSQTSQVVSGDWDRGVPSSVREDSQMLSRFNPAAGRELLQEARRRVKEGVKEAVEKPVSKEFGWVQPVLGLKAVWSPVGWFDVWGYGGLGGLGWGGIEESWEWAGGVRWKPYRGKVDVGLDLGIRGQSFSYQTSTLEISQQWYSPFVGGTISF